MQGKTKREGYFPKGKWYNLFDNTTIDTHDGGKSVTLDLPMGHVGAHMMGGSILPMQPPALVTAAVRASPLTLVVALPHMEPLAHFAHTARLPEAGESRSSMGTIAIGQPQKQSQSSHGMVMQSSSRKMMASMQAQSKMAPGLHAKATAQRECAVSEPGRVTACGQVFMDNNDALQVRIVTVASMFKRLLDHCESRDAILH